MNKALITLALTSALATSQTIVLPVKPSGSPETAAERHNEAARPLMGYMTDDSNVLRSVVGSVRSPQWGDPLSLPDNTVKAFLPPRQEFVLLASGNGLSVAKLSRSRVYPGALIPNAIAIPDQVAFSPSGGTLALFSTSEKRIEVVASVTAEPQIRWRVGVPDAADLQQFTISDDGDLLVATFANRSPVFSWRGTEWHSLSTSYRLDAFTFLPGSHDLIVSDRTQKSVVLLPEPDQATIPMRLLAAGMVDADLLATDKQGNHLLAMASGSSTSWSIDLATGAMTALSLKGNINSLTVLRDGQTALVSQKDLPVVIAISTSGNESSTTNPSR